MNIFLEQIVLKKVNGSVYLMPVIHDIQIKNALALEEQQIIDAILAFTGLNHASPTDDTNMKAAQDYFNQKYKP